jgi:hypothetical protein
VVGGDGRPGGSAAPPREGGLGLDMRRGAARKLLVKCWNIYLIKKIALDFLALPMMQ